MRTAPPTLVGEPQPWQINRYPGGIDAVRESLGRQRHRLVLVQLVRQSDRAPGLQGDPYVECRPECTVDSDCPRTLACISQKCKDPCVYDNRCGINAICEVTNHRSVCVCPPGYEGNAYQLCTPIRERECLYRSRTNNHRIFFIFLFLFFKMLRS